MDEAVETEGEGEDEGECEGEDGGGDEVFPHIGLPFRACYRIR